MMHFFDVHTHHVLRDKNVISIVNFYPNSKEISQPFSVGIHPWFINQKELEKDFLLLEEKVKNSNCYAIGEAGLDKVIDINFELQKEVFIKQIQFSEKNKKPLIIHCVKAYQEIVEIKNTINPNQQWVMHGFQKNSQIAKMLLKNKIVLSFGQAIFSNKKLQNVLAEVPLSSILLETDDKEVSIKDIYKKVAEIKNIQIDKLQNIIGKNFNNIFKK